MPLAYPHGAESGPGRKLWPEVKMKHFLLLLIVGILSASVAKADEPSIERTDFMTGLQKPWDLAFTPDGFALYTERCHGLSVRKADGKPKRLFGVEGSALLAEDLVCEGQSGMLGVAVDPEFASNRFIYVYMASNISVNPRTNRVIRLVVNDDYTNVSDRLDIITDIPYKDVANHWGDPGSHSGGRLRFGPDGYLYVTTGDNHNGPLPQDITRLGGKVLRVNREGKAAPDNGVAGDERIFTFGHRNTQGLTFHPITGQPFVAEHGPNHSDEITALVPGGNGGWDPKPEAGVECADNYCGYISNKLDGTLTPMTDLAKFPDAMRPFLVYEDSQGLGPVTFLVGKQWKDWDGALMVGIMAAKQTEVLQIDKEGRIGKRTIPSLPAERARSLVPGPGSELYVVTDEGSIWVLRAP